MRLFAALTRWSLSSWVGIRTAFIEMRQHKLRSFLSILGVLLGVAALVAMLSLIGGIETFLEEKMGRWAGAVWIRRSRHPADEERLAWSRSPGLRLSDGMYLEEESEEVGNVYHSIDRRATVVVAGERFHRARARGLSKEAYYADSNTVTIDKGRFFTEQEYEQGSKVCLISWGIQEQVLKKFQSTGRDTSQLLQQAVHLRSVSLDIVGTLKSKDEDFKPWHWSRTVVLPLRTMQKYVTGYNPDPEHLSLTVAEPDLYEEQTERVTRDLTQLHRGAQDFEYRSADWADNMKKTMGNISLVMGIISLVSLLVGGMGIMNVMLSSISERIKEIGIRKALGARNSQIFIQFLAETTALSFTGGVVGAVLGLAPLLFAEAIKKSTRGVVMPTVLPEHVIFVFVIIISVGIIFGLYPALKASRMNPVEALRYE